MSLIVSAFAIAQRNRANANAATADHELLVSESRALLDSNRQLATLLAIEADGRRAGADTRDALMNAVLAEPRLQRTFGGPVIDMALLSGHRIAVVTADHELQVWDWTTGQRDSTPMDDGSRSVAATNASQRHSI